MNVSPEAVELLKLLGIAFGGAFGAIKFVSWVTKLVSKMQNDIKAVNEHLENTDASLEESKTEAKESRENIQETLDKLMEMARKQSTNEVELKFMNKRIDALEKANENHGKMLQSINDTVNNIRVDLQNKANR